MFISFPVIVSEWVELSLMVSSLRNDAFSDKHVRSCKKYVRLFLTKVVTARV